MANTDSLNKANIALMLVSCFVAFFIPFQLFLFAYAFLGPAHYLTEISWLHKRRFFTKGKNDYWLLGGLAVAAVATVLILKSDYNSPQLAKITSASTFFAFGTALVFILTEKMVHRILGLAIALALALLTVNANALLAWMIALFGTTLVHVYVFTGFFIIYGALKERSRSGYLSFCIFLICPILFVLVRPESGTPSQSVVTTYWTQFSALNRVLLGVINPQSQTEADNAVRIVFKSDSGLVLMRFIAFAYTYHYLNWFSKTSFIKWHDVPRRRLALLGGLWLICVALYMYDYVLGFKVLTFLSLMHVYLEFPLNHISIIGTFRELFAGPKVKSVPALSARRHSA